MDYGFGTTYKKSMKTIVKKWLNIVGGLIGLAGVIFVFFRLRTYQEQINFNQFGTGFWFSILGLALFYACANIFLARSWFVQLNFFNMAVRWPWTLWAYGFSQLGKYVPGNIFHLAGRQTLGMAAGFPAADVAKTALIEFLLLSIAGTFFSIMVLPLIWGSISTAASVLIFIISVLLASTVCSQFYSMKLTVAWLWQLFFLSLSAITFMMLLILIGSEFTFSIAVFSWAAAYIIAWLAGLVTPGAPAGMGVREVVLLLLLGQVFPEDQLLLATILGRIVTVLGDIIFFSAALFAGKPSASIVN